MPATGTYLDMPVAIDDLDQENLAFYNYCASGELHLQQCKACNLKRYPPTTACPFCAHADAVWCPVGGRGTIYSLSLIHI